MEAPRLSVDSGSIWEPIAGFSRATRIGTTIRVSGTTATSPLDGACVGGADAGAQTTFALDLIEASLKALGGGLEHVVRTRLLVRNVDEDWEAIARAHGQRFARAGIRPSNTLVGAPLVGEEYLVEIEAEAELPPGSKLPPIEFPPTTASMASTPLQSMSPTPPTRLPTIWRSCGRWLPRRHMERRPCRRSSRRRFTRLAARSRGWCIPHKWDAAQKRVCGVGHRIRRARCDCGPLARCHFISAERIYVIALAHYVCASRRRRPKGRARRIRSRALDTAAV